MHSQHDIVRLCNGSTTDSDSVCLGSNPGRTTKNNKALQIDICSALLFLYLASVKMKCDRTTDKSNLRVLEVLCLHNTGINEINE